MTALKIIGMILGVIGIGVFIIIPIMAFRVLRKVSETIDKVIMKL